MKLDEDGEVLRYRHFPGNWNEVFTYTLDLKNGRIMVSGVIFYASNDRQGFVAMFDQQLSLLWCRQFTPMFAYGESIMTNDGGAIVIRRSLVVKLDGTGRV